MVYFPKRMLRTGRRTHSRSQDGYAMDCMVDHGADHRADHRMDYRADYRADYGGE